MEPLIFTDAELQLGTERSRKYQGTAKIDLDHISFHPNFSRAIEQKNINRLCEIFRKEGCRRFEVQNHVTAVVSRESLQSALRAARKTPEELLTAAPEKFPHLQFSAGQILCLHGQHRIRAGAEVLPEGDRWWTVDLYLDDISPGLRTALIEEYMNERQPSDGEIYRKIHQYQQEHNARFQKRWWARLSENKARRLRQLQKNIDISAAFNALLPIPGVWGGMSIGKLAKVMAIDCDEEIVHYLTSHVRNFWVSLVSADAENPDLAAMMKIDLHTVKKLELMAPGISREDARAVHGWVLSGEVLSAFSATERDHIWERLQRFDGLIPSLHTFFRDIDYLERCAHAMKRLFVLSKTTPTLRAAMRHQRAPTRSMEEGCLVQTSESRFERRPGSHADHLELAYRQVWLYAMRHYSKMAPDPESDDLLAKPGNEKADETVVYEMAVLAQKLGFQSTAIQDIIDRSPDRQIARDCLLKARKPDCYEYPADVFETLIRRIVECFSEATPHENPLPPDFLVHFSATRKGRSGLPSTRAQKQDRRFLFIDHLHTTAVASMEKVSTMSVRRCVYFAFFGRPLSHSPSPAVDRISSRRATSNIPMSPLFLSDDEHLGGFSPVVDMPLEQDREIQDTGNAEGRLQREAEQRRLQREAAAAEQERLQREAEASERERLQREAEAAEQANSRREAEERAAAAATAAADQQRLQQEAEAAEQSRLQREAEERAAEERLRQAEERAIAEAAEEERVRKEAEERAAAEAAEQARLQREAEEQAAAVAEQERLQQEAAAAEQYRLQREAEERAAEQERLQREEEERVAVAAEQERIRREAEERAASEAAERERLHQEAMAAEQARLQREAEEAAEQERVRREAEQRAAAEAAEREQRQLEEDARAAQEIATTLAQLERDGQDVPRPPEAISSGVSRPVTQLDLPSLITRLREESSQLDNESTINSEFSELPAHVSGDSPPTTTTEAQTVEAPTTDVSVPRAETAGLEPIPEEYHQRPLRENAARPDDKKEVENTGRAAEETEDDFTQTRNAEDEDLFVNESDEEPTPQDVETVSSEQRADPALRYEDAGVSGQEHLQDAGVTTPGEGTTDQPPPVTAARRKSRPLGIYQARKSAKDTQRRFAPYNPTSRKSNRTSSHTPPASSAPSTRPLTQIDFQKLIPSLPAWPGENQGSQGGVNADPTSTQEEAESPPTAPELSSLWRRRRTKPSSRRKDVVPARADPRYTPNRPSNHEAGTITFKVWKGGQWRELERVTVNPSDPFHIERVAKRYERDEHAEFYDKDMYVIKATQCFQVAQDQGTYSIFMIFNDGPMERTITRAMVTAANALSTADVNTEPARSQKPAR